MAPANRQNTPPGVTETMIRRVPTLFLLLALGPAALGANLTMKNVSYQGWSDCILLTDGRVEVIVTTGIGPRIMRFGFVGGPNLFFENPADLGRRGGTEWRIYGGHRFWHAPEIIPRTYSPDNSPIAHEWDGSVLKLIQPVEPDTGIRKEMEVRLDPDSGRVTILHRAVNLNPWEIELAPWALSAMAPGGRAVLPQEKYVSHDDYVLPARPLVLWHYTNMTDPRWTWGKRYIQLRQDPSAKTEQKIGILNTLGWAAYALGDNLFIKRFRHYPGADYPDFGSNNEVFTNSAFLEIESLGPLTRLKASGGVVEFTEEWRLFRALLEEDEDQIDKTLRPLIAEAARQP